VTLHDVFIAKVGISILFQHPAKEQMEIFCVLDKVHTVQ
jgi:hypothetical protein